MDNTINIHADSINVYATLSVKAKLTGKIVLSVLIIGFFSLLVLALVNIKPEDIGDILLPLVILTSLIVAFPVRYLLWNLYGQESLIINTKTISYSYDYGFVRTRLKTISYNKLGTELQLVRKENEGEYGRLVLYNYNKETNLPKTIHQTSILINCKKLKELEAEINTIFENEFLERVGFIGYSIN